MTFVMRKYLLANPGNTIKTPQLVWFKQVSYESGESAFSTFAVPVVWALVEDEPDTFERRIIVIGTGNTAPDPFKSSYIGTVLMPSTTVLHAFLVWGDDW